MFLLVFRLLRWCHVLEPLPLNLVLLSPLIRLLIRLFRLLLLLGCLFNSFPCLLALGCHGLGHSECCHVVDESQYCCNDFCMSFKGLRVVLVARQSYLRPQEQIIVVVRLHVRDVEFVEHAG